MTSKRSVLRQQRAWAKSAGIHVDARGFIEAYESNLLRPLSPSTLAAFESGGGSELRERGKRPAKMRALHSSAALAVNVFDHWVGRDAGPLLQALGIESTSSARIAFERPFPTGLPGNPPNVDVVLTLDSGAAIAIESKFTEWLTPKRKGKPAFKEKYFADGAERWARAGLPACQALATDLQSGRERFRQLDAPQLLKHALGLAAARPKRFALRYLFYEIPSPSAERHESEIARFSARVDSEVGFGSVTYQDLYRALRASDAVDRDYLAYLGKRYFPEPA